MILLIESAIKVSAIVLIALGATALLRKESAALRHWVLSVAIACAAALPVLIAVMPAWHAVAPAPLAARLIASPDANRVLQDAQAPVESLNPLPISQIARAVEAVWIAGLVVGVAVVLVGLARLSWIARRCGRIRDGRWTTLAGDIAREYGLRRPVTLLQSDHPTLLVTWGLLSPKVILPADAVTWNEERSRVVLYHELAHIRRGDWIVQMMAELVRCVYWFNPLLWIASRRLRLESEHACDDAVLVGGVRGSDYAAALLDLAGILNKARQPWFPAPAMARPSSLERRISVMLNARINRLPLTRFARVITIAALAAITLPLASLAQQSFSTLSGSVFDASDGLLPATKVILTNTQTNAKYEVTSDRSGRFEFVGLPSGAYALETALPGFATARATLTIAGQDIQQDIKLQVAGLEETVTVTEGPGTGRTQTATRRPLPACTSAPVVGGIGGQIRPPMRVRNVDPAYPANVPGSKSLELVTLGARIRSDGTMGEINVIGEANPAFVNAALDAVRQWEYDETLLNCVPIEVTMKVTVRFRSAAQEQSQIRLQLALPNGARPQLASAEGELGTLTMPDVGAFGFRSTVKDRDAGLVTVALQEGIRAGGKVLGEVTLRVGDAPVKMGPKDEFTVAVISIR